MPGGRRLRACAARGVLVAAVVAGLLSPSGVGEVVAHATPLTEASDAADTEVRSALTEQQALARAEESGELVEVTSLRGETREVFATPKGSLEAREHLRPVWTRVAGEWQPVDTDLAVTSEGTVAPKAVTVDLEFSGGGSGPLVRMVEAGRELELSWPGELPSPQLEGDTVTYPEVLPGVDLRMGAREDGFTQLLVVKSAEAAASAELAELWWELDAVGLEVRETVEGGLEAVDEDAGRAVFEASRPMMWDSSSGPAGSGSDVDRESGRDSEPGAGESGKLAPVGVEVPAGGETLVLTPDADVLKGADTVYPVFIDPQWYTPKASAWTVASKYWASSPLWKFNGDPDAGMGYCDWEYCQPHDTMRLFYQFPVSTFAGKSILSAEFVVRNTWSASCEARGVDLWQTQEISSSTTWNSQNAADFWVEHLQTRSFAHGYEGCAARDAEFLVTSAVQSAADDNWQNLAFGLQASSESDAVGWKRFADDAYLRVYYNSPPAQVKMSQLTMQYGGACQGPASAARARMLGTIYANDVTDPDGDRVAVQFQAKWDSGDGQGLIVRWDPGLTTARRSGSGFAMSLPSSIPANRLVHWYVRVHDGNAYSPWSWAGDATGCYFVLDTSGSTPAVDLS